MKRIIAAVSVLSLFSLGAANAAFTTYDFENAAINAGGVGAPANVPFNNGLTALGISSAALSGVTGSVTGVQNNGGNQPTSAYGAQSFGIGFNGTWTINFTSPVTSFRFDYWETNNEVGTPGFTARAFNGASEVATSSVQPGPVNVAGNNNAPQFGTITLSAGSITSVTIFDNSVIGGDNVFIDNIATENVTVSGVPEPSTYLMIGSALAGIAAFRRRRS
jgi:hypothetical protein